jgi:transcriptional regulator with XRE-family HTH domain
MDIVKKQPVEGLPEKLKEARLKDGRSVQLLATMAELSTAYWYQLENNKREWVSEDIINRIEKVLGVELINFTEGYRLIDGSKT